jgi:transposase InsO family protein
MVRRESAVRSDDAERDREEAGGSIDARSGAPRPYAASFSKDDDSQHTKRVVPNLLERDFNAPAPNQVVAGDITYISTSDGWLSLAALLDLYSWCVVGWALSDCIETELALSALRMAASTRGLAPGWVHHTETVGRSVLTMPTSGAVGDWFATAAWHPCMSLRV